MTELLILLGIYATLSGYGFYKSPPEDRSLAFTGIAPFILMAFFFVVVGFGQLLASIGRVIDVAKEGMRK